MAKLLVDEDGKRRVTPLAGSAITVGRGADNEIVIQDPKSSRKHCTVRPDGDGYVLEDLHSSNGTYLNEELAQKKALRHGDVISVGKVNITFISGDGAEEDDAEAPAAEAPSVPATPEAEEDLELDLEMPDEVDEAKTAPATQAMSVDEILESQPDDDILESAAAAEVAPSPGSASQPTLEFLDGDRKGDRVSVETTPFYLGRKSENDLVIPDARASGVHARILEAGGEWFVEDRESGNGVFVGRKKVKRHRLRSGEVLTIGSTHMRVGGIAGEPARAGRGSLERVMDGVDEGGFSEDDLSRLDVRPALEQSSPMQAVFTVVFLLLVGAVLFSGYWVSAKMFASTGGLVARSMLKTNPSFESVNEDGSVAGWEVAGSAASVTIASIEPTDSAPDGKRVLEVTATAAPAGGSLRVQSTDTLEAPAGEGIRLSAKVRNQGFDLAGLELIWLVRTEDGTREVGSSFTRLIRNSAGYESLGGLFVPPADLAAERVRVAFFATGRGSMQVDAVIVNREPVESKKMLEQKLSSPYGAERDLTFQFRDDGSLSIRQGRSSWAPGVYFATYEKGRAPLGQLVALNSEAPQITESGAVRNTFALLAGNDEIVVSQRSQVADGEQRIRWGASPGSSGTEPEYCAVVELGSRALKEPMALFRGRERVAGGDSLASLDGKIGTEWVVGEDSSQVILGTSVPVELRVLPESLCRAGRPAVALCVTGGLPGGVLELYVSPISSREQERIADLQRAIQEARGQGLSGQTVKLIDQLLEEYAHLSSVCDAARELRTEVMDETQSRLAELQEIQADLETYGCQPVRALLTSRLDDFTKTCEGLPQVAAAREIARDLESESSQAVSVSRANEASSILQSGMNHVAQNRDQLARFYFEWVRKAHPDTDEAQQAAHQISLIDARKTR